MTTQMYDIEVHRTDNRSGAYDKSVSTTSEETLDKSISALVGEGLDRMVDGHGRFESFSPDVRTLIMRNDTETIIIRVEKVVAGPLN